MMDREKAWEFFRRSIEGRYAYSLEIYSADIGRPDMQNLMQTASSIAEHAQMEIRDVGDLCMQGEGSVSVIGPSNLVAELDIGYMQLRSRDCEKVDISICTDQIFNYSSVMAYLGSVVKNRPGWTQKGF
ncbi:hypothetical protein GF351_06245 [Candidatus Woesearchaeota archaeon]|nr:hypothetical protein [Candidatus Woesearchaeota archaeon]